MIPIASLFLCLMLAVYPVSAKQNKINVFSAFVEKDSVYRIDGENGIDFLCSDKKQSVGTRIDNHVFEKCNIVVPQDYLDIHNGQPVNRKGRTENISGVHFKKCNINALF